MLKCMRKTLRQSGNIKKVRIALRIACYVIIQKSLQRKSFDGLQ